MIRKLTPKTGVLNEEKTILAELLESQKTLTENDYVQKMCNYYSNYNIHFYSVIGVLLEEIGFSQVSVTRDGDPNNRVDALIVSKTKTIPIEIKSPKETLFINIKAIRQALENKIVLLSRNPYPTTEQTTSLAIGFSMPNKRSGVYELVEDIKNTYGFNIGLIDLSQLLALFHRKYSFQSIDINSILELQGSLKI